MEGIGGASGGGGGEEQGEKMKPLEGEIKTNKRKMKTASQLEILEKTYAVDAYPSEALRAELSVQLGLSDRQLQMWFCHRRLKDRKQPSAKRQRKDSPPPLATPVEEAMPAAGQVGNDHLRQSNPFGHGMDPRRLLARPSGVAVPRISVTGDFHAMKRHYKPLQSIAEIRAIAFVEAQLGEPLREDGPILGMEFDPLPPGAFGAPIGALGQQKQPGIPFEANIYERPDAKPVERLHEYQFLPQQPTVRGNAHERVAPSISYNSPPDFHNAKTAALTTFSPFEHANEQGPSGSGFPSREPSLSHMPQEGKLGHILPYAARDYETVPRKLLFTNISMDAQFGAQSFSPIDNPSISTDRPLTHSGDILRMERKLKGEEARIVREVEAHEKRIRKELEKQDILRRKREEQIRKEMERHDRERRKEEERLSREKQREEERFQREQRRELERREKFLQRESIRAEKMRQKEELRREKEAARQKAASERAVARRIAKESTELVEDERLELMELAASSKGLPSVLSLDFETLQNLDSYRDKLNAFPPKSVLLKKPFAIQPWRDSEENVGNLLMVWRFLFTFADVLGIWPFTLDEFVQAFHDYDPRLLGEIHIALLRCIIKDIEDVARTPASGLGTNQNCANPGGGHPQIVEGAYMWGFDIRSWQHHLNPLTWPEILRQFALSAGFGPQLKTKDIDQAYSRGDNEGNDGEDAVTILRSGAAVENAVALMQERGFPSSRRSRHRLTPGTVKFAAFHVLSFEGSKGLTILEVADKIQKSGLRDLTTSKTPEASVSAALSRDTKLFERTAPSTYCVRPAYRKDPEDTEEILSAAREKIRLFKSGFADGEGADDAERDDDSESDGAEDPEVDDLGPDLKSPKHSPEANNFSAKALLGNGKRSDELSRTPQVCLQNMSEALSSLLSEGKTKAFGASVDQSLDIAKVCSNLEKEDAYIDESNPGEPWVQGLMEVEYSDLTVEERLNALVALVGVAIEGTSVRVVLEERLEAANALKKQMWAEAQLDKRRMKEESVIKIYHSSVAGNKMESNLTMSNAECTEFPFVTVADKSNGVSVSRAVQRERLNGLQNNMNDLNDMPSEGNIQMQDLSTSLDNLPYQQPGHAAEKSRSQLKSLIGHRAEEIYVYRSLPLGQDRRRNRYWQFATSVSCYDPGCGRIFVELQGGQWRLIDSEEGFDALVESLDARGSRESHLYSMLQKIEISFKETARRNILQASAELQNGDIVKSEAVEQAVGRDCTGGTDSPGSSICVADNDIPEASTSFTVELGRNETEKIHALWRYQDFEKWMWKECFNSSMPFAMKYGNKQCMPLLGICDYCSGINFLEDSHCSSCHRMYDASGSNLNISEHMAHCVEKLMMDAGTSLCGSAFPLRIRILKLLLALLEVSVPPGAFLPVWTNGYRRSWGMKLWSSSSADDLLQILTLLEGAIKKDYFSSNFGTTIELLGLPSTSQSDAKYSSCIETVPILPWLPLTTAAIALRVMELDASISYMPQEKVNSQDRSTKGFMQFPSKYAVARSTQHCESTEASHQGGNRTDVGIGLLGLGPGQGSRGQSRGRTHGGRSQRKVMGSRLKDIKKKTGTNTKAGGFRQMAWKAQPRSQRGHRRGRRSLRSKQKSVKKAVSVVAHRNVPIESTCEDSSRVMVEDQWVGEKSLQVDGIENENASSSEIFEYDENGQASGDEYEDLAANEYACAFNVGPSDLLEESYINLNGDAEDEDADEDADEQGDVDLEEYINGDSDEKRFKEANLGPMEDPDDGVASGSSDFSD